MAAKVRRCCCRHKKQTQTNQEASQPRKEHIMSTTTTEEINDNAFQENNMTDVELGSSKKAGTTKDDGRIKVSNSSCCGPFTFTSNCWEPFVRTCSKQRKRLAMGAIAFLVLSAFGSICGAAAWTQSEIQNAELFVPFPKQPSFSEMKTLFEEWQGNTKSPLYKVSGTCSGESMEYPLSIRDVILSTETPETNSRTSRFSFRIRDKATWEKLITVQCEDERDDSCVVFKLFHC